MNSGLFSSRYLDQAVSQHPAWQCDERAEEALESLYELYLEQRDVLDAYVEDELREAWIDEVLDQLGFDHLDEPSIPRGRGEVDYLLFDTAGRRRDERRPGDTGTTEETFRRAVGILEAKRWNEEFDGAFTDRAYRNASSQVRHYLTRTPENVRWGFLTNGRKWRIYGTRTYETRTFYEVDLVELLERGDVAAFKYFYVFFRRTALRGPSGESFLDDVWSESETFAQQQREDLRDNVFTAVRVLGQGFVDCNGLDLETDDEEALRRLKEQSLLYLYRVMFVLYAEGRGLLHPESPEARAEYGERFGLEAVRREIVEKAGSGPHFEAFSTRSEHYWNRLQNVFELVDDGDEKRGLPAYDGGLFDDEENEFLAANGVPDAYLARAIYYLSTATTGDGDLVYVDYGDLDTRHLGSVYEGLLEHRFAIAERKMAAVPEDGGQVWKPASEVSVDGALTVVEEGDLYLVNDDGERRSTGSYYTPDYVVSYIVEGTLDPILDDIRQSLEDDGYAPGTEEYAGAFSAEILDLAVVDPAMGSGHFLTAVTSYLTERVQDVAREAGATTVVGEEDYRRKVAKECIYGVDLNEMAVELAKLSMWLETLASDGPSTALDHHLKHGNSLLGADLDQLDELLAHGRARASEDDRSTVDAFGKTIQHTIDELRRTDAKVVDIDDDTVENVGRKTDLCADVEAQALRERLAAIANVHVATHFGVDVPADAYDDLKEALRDAHETPWEDFTAERWFREAQEIAAEHEFFHWKLEFPEVFSGTDRSGAEPGFDAVVGNPPYLNLEAVDQEGVTDALQYEYPDIFSGKADVHYFFCGLGVDLVRNRGGVGLIVSRYFTEAYYANGLRGALADRMQVAEIVDFGNNQVFPGVDTLAVVIELTNDRTVEETTITYLRDDLDSDARLIRQTLEELSAGEQAEGGGRYTIDESSLGRDRWLILPRSVLDIKRTVEANGTRLEEVCRTGQGMMTGLNEAFTVTPGEIAEYGIEDAVLKPLVKNGDLRKYRYDARGLALIYLEDVDVARYPNTEEYLDQYRDALENRAKDSVEWYRYLNPINRDLFEEYDEKIICPFVATENRFYLDRDGLYNDGGDVEVVVPDGSRAPRTGYLVCLLNSTLIEFYHLHHAKLKRDGFHEYFGNSLRDIPIRLEPNDGDVDLTVLPDVIRDDADGESVEAVLHHANDVMTELLAERTDLDAGLDPFEYLRRSAPVDELPDVLSEEVKYGRKVDEVVFDRRHDVTDLALVEESSGDWLLRAECKLRRKTGDEYEWKREDDSDRVVREVVDLYRFPADRVDYRRMNKYRVVLDHYDEFDGKSPKNGFPGGKTRTVREKLNRTDLPVVDEVDMEPYFELEAELDAVTEAIRSTYDAIDRVVYDLYDVGDDEIEKIESTTGVGLGL